MRVARVNVDLMRPVPVAPLTIEARCYARGARSALRRQAAARQGVVVVSATVLKIKMQANELPPEAAIEHGRAFRGRSNRASSPSISPPVRS